MYLASLSCTFNGLGRPHRSLKRFIGYKLWGVFESGCRDDRIGTCPWEWTSLSTDLRRCQRPRINCALHWSAENMIKPTRATPQERSRTNRYFLTIFKVTPLVLFDRKSRYLNHLPNTIGNKKWENEFRWSSWFYGIYPTNWHKRPKCCHTK